MSDDRATLIAALETAVKAYDQLHPRASLLGPEPEPSILGPLQQAIDACEAYRAVAGHVLFSGGSGPVISAESIASRLFSSVSIHKNISDAADKLLRMLTTRRATGLFKGIIWGLALDKEVPLGNAVRLLPFTALDKSYMTVRISERAKLYYDGSPWIAQNFYDLPSAAFIEAVPDFPYIGTDGAAFKKMAALEWRAHELGVLLQGASVGSPLAIACWFEWEDRDLEYAVWENQVTWLIPEIPPHVKQNQAADVAEIVANQANYAALPDDRRSRLLRSMERFRLSQCRREAIDQVLDLALALEIAVSEKGDGAPPSWKVSVRTAQVIGGTLATRQENRAFIGSLYELRNQATHGGGTLKTRSKRPVDEILQASSKLYVSLVKRLLSLRVKPDWKAVELEAL